MRRIGTRGIGDHDPAARARPAAPAGRRVVAVGAAAVLAMSPAACGKDEPQTPAAPAPVAVPPPEIVTVAPTSAAPTRAPDVDLASIRSAPPACGLPVHHLSDYQGEVGTTRTTLQVTDGYAMGMPPVEPVQADVTGDGGLDLVGVLSCTVDEAPKPDSLALYTGPATPAASLDLGTVRRQKYAVVRALRVVGGDVRVEWTTFDRPDGPVTQNEGTLAWRAGKLSLVEPRRSSGPRGITVTAGAFLTADGNVACVVQDDVAWCDVARSTWTPPPSPTTVGRGDSGATNPAPSTASTTAAATPAAGASGTSATTSSTTSSTTSPAMPSSTTDPTQTSTPAGRAPGTYGRTFLLRAGRAVRTCPGEQGPEVAALGAPLTTWHRSGWDATVVVDGRRSAAMTPGSSMSTSAITCRAGASVVTCTDSRTKASFEVGRTVARLSTD